MKVILGSVVKGFTIKEAIKAHLTRLGHDVVDVGCRDTSRFVKYTSVGQRVAAELQRNPRALAINCCGSGTGAALAAGTFRGVLACSCESVLTARLIRVVNQANCLCLGEQVVTPELACQMADAFLGATFQDAPGIPAPVLAFWQEAHDEIAGRGPVAAPREVETL